MRSAKLLRFGYLAALIGWFACMTAQAGELRLAVTTSFNNSGLSDWLLPEIERDLGIDVELLVVGTGQALRLARAGDVDAVIVHARKAEEDFVSSGHATHRREIMYNDFVLIGPEADPAAISGAVSAVEALSRIRDTRSPFVSRGDNSGTHKRELALWATGKLDPAAFDANWYRAVGAGMGTALNIASGMDAYILTDRASWLKFGNKGGLALLYQGDPDLLNQYAYLPVNPARHPHVNQQGTRAMEQWLTGKRGQALIGAYRVNAEQLFYPNAQKR